MIGGLVSFRLIVPKLGSLAVVLFTLENTYPGISGASGIVIVSPNLPVILIGFRGVRISIRVAS